MAGGIAGYAIRMKNSGPRWIGSTIERLLASEAWVIRWAKERLAARSEVPEVPKPDVEASERVLFAPFNYAGQGGQWARSLEDSGPEISARSFTTSAAGFRFETDAVVPLPVFVGSSEWKARLDRGLGAYSHVVIESFGSLFGRGSGAVVLDEVERLRARGVEAALLCHGSEIRSPRAAIEREPFLTAVAWGSSAPSIQRTADRNRRVLDRFDGTVFVSTPDLMSDVPEGRWLPVVVDAERWASAGSSAPAAGERAPIRVVHAPSNAGLKGTGAVDAAAARLEREGLIEYRRLEGIPSPEMPEVIAGADIVVDQLLLGSYGVAACEAMAAGRTVVGNVSAEVRAFIADRTGLELPIVQADPVSLEQVLRRLVRDRAAFAERAAAGERFVRAVHSGIRTRQAMAEFLGRAPRG